MSKHLKNNCVMYKGLSVYCTLSKPEKSSVTKRILIYSFEDIFGLFFVTF